MESSLSCSRCSAPTQPGARFCSACGRPVNRRLLDSERRQLTFLFCDVVDSTVLSEKLDPEDLSDLLSSYQTVCRDAVALYEGHVSQFLGDGIMSYFGYPIAHEDDAVRATRAALRLTDGTKIVNQGIGRRLGVELHVRVGLHTGVAVVGELGPSGTHDRLAVGETVNLAARIQGSAAPDTVVVSLATAKLIEGHFQLESLDARSLKGISRPIELFRVVEPTGARTKLEAAARGQLTPRVGAGSELAKLTACWTEVQGGADRIVVIRGEAGIGKSRVVHDFKQTALASGAEVLECVCSPLTQTTALAPIIEMLNAQVARRAGGETTSRARLAALDDILREQRTPTDDLLPLMSVLLSIPGADVSSIQDLSPVRRRTRTFEIIRSWLASSARSVPVALLVEDAHWADPSTLDLLDSIVNVPSGGRTLVCVTARPELRDRWSSSNVRTLDVLRLAGEDAAVMVTHVAGGHALPALLVQQIVERSEGVPLFIEEVTKAVLESSDLRLDENRFTLAHAHEGSSVPVTVQASLVARFDRLGESRVVAQFGATIGRDFAYRLIRAVTGKSDAELREHLDRLCRSELVFSVGQPPDAIYTFKHALIQDAIYGTLLKKDRALMHERVFAKLRDELPEVVEARPEMAAYHAEHAGLRHVAVPLLKEAGVRAFGRTAMVEASKHLSHAIDLVDALPEPDRTSVEMDLQAIVGPTYMATLGWAVPEVQRSSERLRDLASARGDVAKLYQAKWSLWTGHFLRGQLDPALEMAQQVLDMAVKSGDPLLRVTGHHAVGFTHERRGEYEDAIRHADEGLALFDLERERRIVAQFVFSSSCAILFFRGQAQLALGQIKSGQESLARAGVLVDELGHAPSRAFLLSQCWSLAVQSIEQVEASAQILRSLAVAEGFALWVHYADIFLAWAAARQGGHAAAAVDQIRTAMTLMHEGRSHVQDNDLAIMFAETLLLASRPEEVFGAMEVTLATARAGKQRHLESELIRLQGDAARAMGDISRAATFYRQAIASARSIAARLLELRATLGLARVGGATERAQLRTVLDGFVDGVDHDDLREASAFLVTRDSTGARGSDDLRA